MEAEGGDKAGWVARHGQIIFMVLVLAGQTLWNEKGISDQGKANEDAAKAMAARFDEWTARMTTRIDEINGHISQIALSQEKLSEHVSGYERDADRRLDRLERAGDGREWQRK